MKRQVLIVDDEEMIRVSVSSYLKNKGFDTITAESGKEAIDVFEKNDISIIILDLMLPDLTGEEVCAKIRRASDVPVIMLTAKTMECSIIDGFSAGADDYITKPFSLKELYVRITAVLRRAAPPSSIWSDGRLSVDKGSRTITKDGENIELTPIEWNILSAFISNTTAVFSRNDLIHLAFDSDFDGYDRVIDTHIKNLRKKIETEPKKPVYILTVHGIGYRFGGKNEKH